MELKPVESSIKGYILPLFILAIVTGCNHKNNSLPQIPGEWTAMANPPGNALLNTSSGFLALNPSSAGISPNQTGNAVWYSSDHANSWTSVLPNYYSNNITVQADLINNANVAAYSEADSTFYLSHNGGQTWGVLNHLAHDFAAVPPIYYDSNGVYYYYSTEVFAYYFFGISGARLFALKYPYYNPSSNTYPVALLKSDDNGSTWDTVFSSQLSGYTNNQYFSTYPVELFSIGNRLNFITYGLVGASSDNGSTWSVINGNSPVTFPGGILANGDIVGTSFVNNAVYISHDSAQSWTQVYQDAGGSLGPILAFDSIVIAHANYMDQWHIIASNPEKINWVAADNGMASNVNFSQYINFYYDNAYVYAFISGGGFYYRPRGDFEKF